MRQLILLVIAFIFWTLLVAGPNMTKQDLFLGVIVALFITILFGDIYPRAYRKLTDPKRYFWFLVYIPLFLWECLKANLDVAYRVLHPDMPIKPGIVKIKTDLKTDMGRTFLGNSITLTPGTMTIDTVEDHYYIHWIYVKSDDVDRATEIIGSTFERLLKRIFE